MNLENKCTISGINDEGIHTLGNTYGNIILGDKKVSQEFQLINEEITIPTDGILGRDFLTKYHCNIDYDTWLLSGTVDSEKF